MARERMVTRTVDETVAEVIFMDVITCEVAIKETTISGLFKNAEEVLSVIKKQQESDTIKVVHVNSYRVQQVLYGLSEADFIKYAKVLPPRNKKEGETDDNE